MAITAIFWHLPSRCRQGQGVRPVSGFPSDRKRATAWNTQPDHDSIAAFRRRFLPQIEVLFVQVLMRAHEMKA